MTTFTGDVNVRTLDSSVTAINLQRGGGAVFTGPVIFTSSVAVSGNLVLAGQASAASLGLVRTTAGNPQDLTAITSAGGRVMARGLLTFTVEGTTAYVPFWYSS